MPGKHEVGHEVHDTDQIASYIRHSLVTCVDMRGQFDPEIKWTSFMNNPKVTIFSDIQYNKLSLLSVWYIPWPHCRLINPYHSLSCNLQGTAFLTRSTKKIEKRPQNPPYWFSIQRKSKKRNSSYSNLFQLKSTERIVIMKENYRKYTRFIMFDYYYSSEVGRHFSFLSIIALMTFRFFLSQTYSISYSKCNNSKKARQFVYLKGLGQGLRQSENRQYVLNTWEALGVSDLLMTSFFVTS